VPDRNSIRSALPYVAFTSGLWLLGRLTQHFKLGAWLDALSFPYQVSIKIALILTFLVLPFAAWIVFMGRRRNG
jgi:hypothetical protein